MTRTFRLLSVTGSPAQTRQTAPYAAPPQSRPLQVAFQTKENGAAPWISIVIGRNGVGKSRLLAGISNALDEAESGRKRSSPFSLSSLTYSCDGKVCEIYEGRNGFSARVGGRPAEPSQLPLPQKIIALSTTPFDKFRIPRVFYEAQERFEEPRPERYSYLGLRDRTGRASASAAIFRAIEGLFEASRADNTRRSRIAEVFHFLGYAAKIDVYYKASSAGLRIINSLADGAPLSLLLKSVEGGQRELLLGMQNYSDADIRDLCREYMSRSDGQSTLRLTADFHFDMSDQGFFHRLQILRKAGLVRIQAVLVQRQGSLSRVDLRFASSGELGIVTGFLGLASVIEDGSLIFIDEPEISLHPEWQARYVELLLKTFGSYSGCHFVLATHSPLILSEIPPENSDVVSLDFHEQDPISPEDLAGKSADYLLATIFKTPGNDNLFLKQQIVKVLRLAANGKVSTTEFEGTLDDLVAFLPTIEKESAIAMLIRELDTVRRNGAVRN